MAEGESSKVSIGPVCLGEMHTFTSDDGHNVAFFPNLTALPGLHGFAWDGDNYAAQHEPDYPLEVATLRVKNRLDAFLSRLGAATIHNAVMADVAVGNFKIVDVTSAWLSAKECTDAKTMRGYLADAGAVFTTLPNVPIFGFAGDCSFSVIYASAGKQCITGLAHAGRHEASWEFGRNVIEYLRDHYGCEPHDIHIGITPSLGAQHHTIKCNDVESKLNGPDIWGDFSYFDSDGIIHLDQNGLLAEQYISEGVPPAQITNYTVDLHDADFNGATYSYRRSPANHGSFAIATQLS